MTRNVFLSAVSLGLCATIAALPARADEPPTAPGDLFAMPGEAILLEEAHCGIINGRLSVGIPYKDVGRIDGLWAPPYVSSDFGLTLAVGGKSVPTRGYVWWPYKVRRTGSVDGIEVSTETVLAFGRRAGVLAITLENRSGQPRRPDIQVAVRGTLDRSEAWEFAAPASRTATRPSLAEDGLVLRQGDLAILLQGSGGSAFQWDAASSTGRAVVALEPGGRATLHLALAMGPAAQATAECKALAANPAQAIREADTEHRRQVEDLFAKIPRLRSASAALVRFYERSLVHLLTNRWDVPEFVLRPYYGTGSVRGGCVCNYLWNFGEVWELLPLVDPAATREHVKQFLKTDLTTHFAFNPLTGAAFGPWYMVNQEKIVGLVYYYVKATGDTAFLAEAVDGRTILEHVLAQAMHRDDPTRPVALIDYGPSNSHLELRRGYPYNHVMPDLNGRRYATYLQAAELAGLSGKPAPHLVRRAEDLKRLLKEKMWNPRTRWLDFHDARGRPDTRWTIQVFKLFSGGVLDAEEEAGLLSHFNQREFLSAQGLHSLSKLDAAYDPADVDNGGPGSCVSFPPQIIERLYKSGRAEVAEDLLGRILWWGERMPYWGDSLVADRMDYRKDTPLQCTLDGAAAAQCLIFGLFGVEPQWDGGIRICPHPPRFAPEIALEGLRLRGQVLDIAVKDGQYEVKTGGRTIRSKVGQAVVVPKQAR